MAGLQLPPHLELMTSDADTLDLFSYQPCEVAGEAPRQVKDTLEALLADPRAAAFAIDEPPPAWKAGAPGVAVEAHAAIFGQVAAGEAFELADGVTDRVRAAPAAIPRDQDFGNGRAARAADASPLPDSEVRTLIPEDIPLPEISPRPGFGFTR